MSHDSTLPPGHFPSTVLSRSGDTVLAVRGSATNPTEPSVEMFWAGTPLGSDLAFNEEPPIYTSIARPREPTTYIFVRPAGDTTRTLLSPSVDARPIYSIAVHPDTFTPFLTNTILFRAPDLQGHEHIAGSFELGLPGDSLSASVMINVSSTPVLKGDRRRMDLVFPSKVVILRSELQRRFVWQFGRINSLRFMWIIRGDSCVCYAHPNPDHARPFDIDMARASKLAELEGRRDEPYRRLTTLKLWPAAHEMPLLEHVVLTALIVERWRMSEGAVSKLKAALGGLIAGTFGREPR